MIRCFIALELSADTIGALTSLQATLQEALRSTGLGEVRWTRAEGMHLTLRFLGDVAPERLDSAAEALARACRGVSPFTLQAEGLGSFPGRGRPRVLWAGLAGETAKLQALHAALEGALTALGFAAETRAYSPHLTLARASYAAPPSGEALRRVLARYENVTFGTFTAREVILFRSDLTPQGARYTRLAQAVL